MAAAKNTHTHADASYTVSPLLFSHSGATRAAKRRTGAELQTNQKEGSDDLNKHNSNTHTHTQTGESGMAFLSSVKFEYLVLRLNFRSERSGIASVSLKEQSNRSKKKEEEKYKTGINRRDCSVSTVSAASASVGKFLTERIAKNDKE